jgi:hypothetical protein
VSVISKRSSLWSAPPAGRATASRIDAAYNPKFLTVPVSVDGCDLQRETVIISTKRAVVNSTETAEVLGIFQK